MVRFTSPKFLSFEVLVKEVYYLGIIFVISDCENQKNLEEGLSTGDGEEKAPQIEIEELKSKSTPQDKSLCNGHESQDSNMNMNENKEDGIRPNQLGDMKRETSPPANLPGLQSPDTPTMASSLASPTSLGSMTSLTSPTSPLPTQEEEDAAATATQTFSELCKGN